MPPRTRPSRARFLRRGAAVFFGLVIVLGSALLAAASTGHLALQGAWVAAPALVLPLCWLGGWAGGAMLVRGLREMAFARRRRRLRAERPDEPWRRDHDWNPDGARERPIVESGRALLTLGVAGSGLAGLHAWAWRHDEWLAGLVLGLFTLFWLVWAAAVALALWRFARHGAVRVEWHRFPLRLGERARFRVACGRPFTDFGRATVTLVCVREKAENVTDADGDSALTHVAHDRHRDERTFTGAELAPELEVAFDLPGGPLATRLGSDAPTYWELHVEADGGPGPRLATALLVPVYARDGAP
ncbi:MAG: hypothetical protein NDJ94_00950 [Vicinamibacteria bacterium]|nr:hypothetical protein [Vicinamibacteria bacterium]